MHLTLCNDVLGCYAYTDWLRDQGLDQEADFLMEIFQQGESGYSTGYFSMSGSSRGWGSGDDYAYGSWGCGDGDGYGDGNGGHWPVINGDGAGYGYFNGGGASNAYIA